MTTEEKLNLAIYTLTWTRDALFGSSLSRGEICESIHSTLDKIGGFVKTSSEE